MYLGAEVTQSINIFVLKEVTFYSPAGQPQRRKGLAHLNVRCLVPSFLSKAVLGRIRQVFICKVTSELTP